MRRFRFVLALLLLVWSNQAIAAKNAYIEGSDVPLYSAPNQDSDVLSNLSNGVAVQVSNYPTQGFYKVRTPSGAIGWVSAKHINTAGAAASTESSSSPPQAPAQSDSAANSGSFSGEEVPPPPDGSASPDDIPLPPDENGGATPSGQQVQSSDTSAQPSESQPESEPESQPESETIPYQDVTPNQPGGAAPSIPSPRTPRLPLEIDVFGGIEKVSIDDLNSLLGTSPFSAVPYFGIQFAIPLSKRFKWWLRGERLTSSKSVSSTDFELSSTPIMTGLSYELSNDPKLSFRASVLAGAAFSTNLDATANAQPQPNVTELSDTPFTEMIKFDASVPMGSVVRLFAEAGFRFLTTASIGPTTIGNGSSVFKSGGNYVPIQLNLTGPFIGAGLGFVF